MENTIRAFFDNSMYKEMIDSFPKQLQQLIEGENEIVEWNSAGSFHKTLLVNFDELQTFLTSSESTFPQIRCIQDFLHVLNLHGFQKYTWVDKKFSGCHRFSHPNFVNKGATENLFEELVPLSMEEMDSSKLLKNHKRLSSNIHYLERLRKAERRKISGHPRNKAKIAEMRAKYMVEKKNVLKKAKAVGKEKLALEQFNVLCREPKYMEEKQMAGCYGNVSLEMLKVAFTSFEPSYQLADGKFIAP